MDAVHSPARLADELFAKELISAVMVRQMGTLGPSDDDKSRSLLIILQSRLETSPADFEAILSVFESSTALSPTIASRLRQAYQQITLQCKYLPVCVRPIIMIVLFTTYHSPHRLASAYCW